LSKLRQFTRLTIQAKRGCVIGTMLTLVACSTASKPTPPPIQEIKPPAVDKPVRKLTPPLEMVNPDIGTDETLSPEISSTTQNKPLKKTAVVKTTTPATPKVALPSQLFNFPKPVIVDKISRTGKLENSVLTEVSGLSASRNSPGVLYAINDGGNSATLYAMSEKGKHIGQWSIQARNRDWEDLDSVELNNRNYIVIGDTGDNRRKRRKSTFYLVAEPLPNQSADASLTPYMTLDFVYEDGPRNVEAFSVHGTTIYLISKEPLSSRGASASRLYALDIPLTQPDNILSAKFLTELPLPRISLESKLAASFVGVDLDHITAMEMSASGRTAYLLTYRQIQRIERSSNETWTKAFQRRGKLIHTHNLGQAEALAIAPGRSVFVTAEKLGAPLWSIPIQTAP